MFDGWRSGFGIRRGKKGQGRRHGKMLNCHLLYWFSRVVKNENQVAERLTVF